MVTADEIRKSIEEIGAKLADTTTSPSERERLAKKWVSLNNMLLMGITGPRTTDGEGVDRTPRNHGVRQ